MKIILSSILLFYSSFLIAQNNNSFNLTINHLALSVTDLDRSAEFYKNVLGLKEIQKGVRSEAVKWFQFSDGKELHLLSFIKDPVTLNKAIHLAITASDFDMFIKKLDDLGVEYGDWAGTPGKIQIRKDGIKQVLFQDPDGFWIEVNNASKD